MKYKIIISFLVCLLLVQSGKSQETIPGIQQIIEKFYATYDLSGLPYPRVEFEKRKDGWYVKTISFEKEVPVRSPGTLFYNIRERSFAALNFEKAVNSPVIDYLEYVEEAEVYNYNLQPYYGYPGWYNDVISEYEGQLELSTNELYALARAYSNAAAGPVTNAWDDTPPEKIYHLPFTLDAFTPVQLKMFLQKQDSAISKYRKLALRDPDFITRVGNIKDKYANEVMAKFHLLLTFSKKGMAEMKFPASIYNDSTVAMARAYLASCPDRSILVTFGDNDFYPVLYLQRVLGFRKDVYLVNYNLLAIDKFIYRATQRQLDAPGIKFSFDTSLYKGNRHAYLYIKDSAATYSVDQLITRLKQQAGNQAVTLGVHIIDMHPGQIGVREVAVLQDVNYLYKNHWVLLDMINNAGKRRIAFTHTFVDELKWLNNYLEENNAVFLYKP